ncbi:hypothetical protein ZWY2020_005269 [Hordeum vulgare]|nr:hypothetical protein ZWY2020_005269 [Hordeum vulgare]
MDHAGGSSSGGNGGAETAPQSLDKPLTQELFNFDLLVPPGCRLAKPWRICKDGYPMLTNPATPEQLRALPAGGSGEGVPCCHRAAIPHPPPTAPAIPAEYEVPPEQFVLREDGDPDDSPGLLVAMRASQAAAAAAAATREEAEIAAAIQATAAAAANPPPDDDVEWDVLADSSDDDDDGGGDDDDGGGDDDGAVNGPVVVYLDSD